MAALDRKSEVLTLRAVILALCLPALTSCPKREFVMYHFELQGCPNEAFSLADSVDQARYRLSPGEPASYAPECPGFKLYDFSEGTEDHPLLGAHGINVRLERGESCSLRVVFPSYQTLEDPVRWAEVVAQLVMQGSGVAPTVPASSKERLGSRKDYETWCARTADTAERSCVELYFAGAFRSVLAFAHR